MENPNFIKTEESVLPTRSTRRKIVVATLLFCWSIIGYIVYAGDPQNSLHTSALSWSFVGFMATIGAYVFGATWENTSVMQLFGKK